MHKQIVFAIVVMTLVSFPVARSSSDPLAHAQASGDVLSSGVVVHGVTRFEKTTLAGRDLISFFVSSRDVSSSSVLIRLLSKYALDKARVSSILYNRLVVGGNIAIRLADVSSLPAGTVLRSDLLEGIIWCRPEPARRDADTVAYMLRCFDSDPILRGSGQGRDFARNDDGRIVYELDVRVTTSNQSTVDQFLIKHVLSDDEEGRKVYVRVER